MMDENEMRRKAVKIAEAKVGFQVHFAIYLAVNAFLIAIWYATTGFGFPWFVFVTFGWGIGIVGHFLAAYRGEGYAQKLAEREFRRMKQQT